MMWVNYPNMPTGAPATPELYRKLIEFGIKHDILICNDNPYSFILTDEHLSILSFPGARGNCLELNSLSKAHNMAGWRIGMVAGAPEIISEILKVKSQMDSGMFRPLQLAAVQALGQGPEWFEKLNAEYKARRKAACAIMDALGAKYNPDSQGLFIWGKIKGNPEEVSDFLLEKAGVFITPGVVFGSKGSQYLRISLCAPVPRLERALEKIKEVL